MFYGLTILRTGALAREPIAHTRAHRNSEANIVRNFRNHAERMCENDAYKTIKATIAEQLKGSKFLGAVDADDAIDQIVVTAMAEDDDLAPPDDGESPPVVALMPAWRFACVIDGYPWLLRARASVTACAIQRPNGFTKLWMTLEGIPNIKALDERPRRKQVAQFLRKVTALEQHIMEPLHTAYKAALSYVKEPGLKLHEDRIRIAIADNYEQPIAKLCDAIYFDRKKPSNLREFEGEFALAAKGLTEFEAFVNEVGQRAIDDSTVVVEDGARGKRAVLFKPAPVSKINAILGLARPAGPSADFKFLTPSARLLEVDENYVRATSAARPVSALLADRQARSIEMGRLQPA